MFFILRGFFYFESRTLLLSRNYLHTVVALTYISSTIFGYIKWYSILCLHYCSSSLFVYILCIQLHYLKHKGKHNCHKSFQTPRSLMVLCSTVTECDTHPVLGVRLMMPRHSCFHGKSSVAQEMRNPNNFWELVKLNRNKVKSVYLLLREGVALVKDLNSYFTRSNSENRLYRCHVSNCSCISTKRISGQLDWYSINYSEQSWIHPLLL